LRGIAKQRTAVASDHIVRAKVSEIGQQIRQEFIPTVVSFVGSCAGGADGSVPFH
jgi:hypothetical protein